MIGLLGATATLLALSGACNAWLGVSAARRRLRRVSAADPGVWAWWIGPLRLVHVRHREWHVVWRGRWVR